MRTKSGINHVERNATKSKKTCSPERNNIYIKTTKFNFKTTIRLYNEVLFCDTEAHVQEKSNSKQKQNSSHTGACRRELASHERRLKTVGSVSNG